MPAVKTASGTVTATIGSFTAGETHLGQVGGHSVPVTPTFTVSASPDYSVGDALGGKLTLTAAVRVSGGSGVLQSIMLLDKANQKPTGTILIFNADPAAATLTDNAAAVLSTDDAKVIAKIPVVTSDWITIDSKALANLTSLGRVVKASSGTSLYAAWVLDAVLNLGSTSDIQAIFGILQD